MRLLPNVLYVGLQKSGSTFLRHYFWSHPDVYCDRHAMFFQTAEADIATRGADAVRADYERRFDATRPARRCHIDMYESIGMGYLFRDTANWSGASFLDPAETLARGPADPTPELLAARVKATLPDAKILMTIRNQVTWLDSGYRHFLSHLPADQRQFSDFLASPEGKISLDAGHFDRSVALYDRLFGADNVLILPLEQLERDETAALQRLVAFLDIPFMPYQAEQKNFNRGNPAPPPAGAAPQPGLVDRLLGRKPAPERPISAAEEKVIRAMYAASNFRLGQRIGLDLGAMGYPI